MKKLILLVALLALSLQGMLYAQGSLFDGTLTVNGPVNTQFVSGSTLYLGGNFTAVNAGTGAMFGINASTGVPLYLPKVTGTNASVNSIAFNTTVNCFLVGGSFDKVGGISRTNLVRLNADLTVNTAFAISVGVVNKIIMYSNLAYVFGEFGGVRINLTTNAIDNSWGLGFDPGSVVKDAEVASGNYMYIGGSLQPSGGAQKKTMAVYNLAVSNGALIPSWDPQIRSVNNLNPNTGVVNDILINGTTMYVGGNNLAYAGTARKNMVVLNLSGTYYTVGTAIMSFNNAVTSIAAIGNCVYVGGSFTQVGVSTVSPTTVRTRLAAFNTSVQLLPWNPAPSGTTITALATVGGQLLVGGDFTTISSSTNSQFAAYDALTAPTTPVLLPTLAPNPNGVPKVFYALGTNILAGGTFSSIVAARRNRVAAFDLGSGGVAPFTADVNGEVFAIHASGSNVYIGGAFDMVNSVFKGKFATLTTTGQNNNNIAANFSATVRAIQQNGNSLYVGGDFATFTAGATTTSSNYLASLNLSSIPATASSGFSSPLATATTGAGVNVIRYINNALCVGGSFTVPRQKFAMLNPTTGAVLQAITSPILANAAAEVNDIAQVSTTSIALGGTFPAGVTNSAFNGSSFGGILYVNPNSGNVTSRNTVTSAATAATPLSILKGTDNAIYYANQYGVHRTDVNSGATASLSNFVSGTVSYVRSLALLSNKFFFGGSFLVTQAPNAFSFNNLGFIDFTPITAPSTTSYSIQVSNVTSGSMTLTWSPGNGARRIVLAKQGGSNSASPANGVTYNAANTYGLGDQIAGASVVYNGSGNSFTIDGLQPNTQYAFRIYEYNGVSAFSTYGTSPAATTATSGDFPTPAVSASNITFSSVGSNNMQITWDRGTGDYCLVIAHDVTAADVSLVQNNNYYPDGTSFGTGTNLGNNNYVIYNGDDNTVFLDNLQSNHRYYIAVVEYNQNGSSIRYKTSNPATANQLTVAMATTPTASSTNINFNNLGSSVTNVNWTSGTGTGNKHMVLAIQGQLNGITSVGTSNGVAYTANSNFGAVGASLINLMSGSTVMGAAKVVYIGGNTSINVVGLLSNTVYTYVVVELNDITGFPTSANYRNTSVLSGYKRTDLGLQPPTVHATKLSSIESSTGIKLSWVNGNGGFRMVVARLAGPVSWAPVSGSYSANANYSAGTDLGSGNKVVYAGNGSSATVTGLTPYTNYYFTVYEYNSVYNTGTSVQEYAYLTNGAPGYLGRTAPVDWPRTGGGIERDAAGGVAVDASGNVFAVGTFKGATNWGLTERVGAGNDIFLAKYNASGDLIWISTAGSTDDEAGAAVVLDAAGNPYITGNMRSTVDFGNSVTLTSAGSDDGFIAKYDGATGTVQWARRLGGTGQDVSSAIARDASGNILIAGYITGQATFSGSSTTLTGLGQSDLFVAKYSSTGTLLWAANGGSAGYDFAFGVAADGNDNVYITGEIKGTSTFGSVNTGTFYGNADIALVKYNSSGIAQYAKGYGSAADDQGLGIAVGDNNQVYMVGAFSNTVSFGSFSLTSAGITDGFVTKIGGADGSIQWAKKHGGLGQDAAGGVSIGTNDNIYVVGSFGGTATFETQTLVSAGNLDIYAAIYTNTSILNSVQKFGGPLDDAARGIFAMTPNNSFICGYFNGTANFGGYDVKARVGQASNGGDWDLFVHNIGSTYNNDPSADLVAWYKLNNTPNDFSGNGFNGTIVSSGANTVTSAADRYATPGSAYNFAGNGGTINFSIPASNTNLNNLNQVTVMGWVNLTDFNPTFGILRHVISTDEADGISLELAVGQNRSVYGAAYGPVNPLMFVQSEPNLFTGGWMHVAFTYQDGVNGRVFLNGDIVATLGAYTSGTVDLAAKRYTIGARGASSPVFVSSSNIRGGLDDIRIYKRALTAVQIQAIMLANSANSIAPPHDEQGEAAPSIKTGIVWPNPSTGVINIQLENDVAGDVSFVITDISGKVVYSEAAAAFDKGVVIKTLHAGDLQGGYYTLQVLKGSEVSTHKLIISK